MLYYRNESFSYYSAIFTKYKIVNRPYDCTLKTCQTFKFVKNASSTSSDVNMPNKATVSYCAFFT